MSPAVTAPVAVVSYDFWQRELGGASSVVGQSIRINEEAFTVIGVAPQGFRGFSIDSSLEVWVPLTTFRSAQGLSNRRGTFFRLVRKAEARRHDPASARGDDAALPATQGGGAADRGGRGKSSRPRRGVSHRASARRQGVRFLPRKADPNVDDSHGVGRAAGGDRLHESHNAALRTCVRQAARGRRPAGAGRQPAAFATAAADRACAAGASRGGAGGGVRAVGERSAVGFHIDRCRFAQRVQSVRPRRPTVPGQCACAGFCGRCRTARRPRPRSGSCAVVEPAGSRSRCSSRRQAPHKASASGGFGFRSAKSWWCPKSRYPSCCS